MSTQGLISIVKDEKVLYKIVAGCNGMKIADLVKCIKTLYQIDKEKINAYYLYHTALNYSFGCKDCLVVFNESELETNEKEFALSVLFLKTFNNPNFNPRWEYGTADYIEIINLNTLFEFN
jgi:hypothetical protein